MTGYENMIGSIRKVYDRIQDDVSREIYRSRMLHSLIDDYASIGRMVRQLPIKYSWIEKSRKVLTQYVNDGYQIVIADAGAVARCVRAVLCDIPWLCFCDKIVKNDKLDDLKVISRQEAINKYGNSVFVISSTRYNDEIERELKNAGISKIYNLGRMIKETVYEHVDKQYFECLTFSDKEIFVDAGCYDCGTILEFQRKTDFKYKKIYSFEPEPKLYENCKKIIRNQEIRNCELINKGLWNAREELHFLSMDVGSRIEKNGKHIIQTRALDEFFENKEPPTFIKMDIEGAELMGLKGGKNILETHAPKLAISIYHKSEDIFTIPEYILSVNAGYKFYFRHYSSVYWDTVLYAYVEN